MISRLLRIVAAFAILVSFSCGGDDSGDDGGSASGSGSGSDTGSDTGGDDGGGESVSAGEYASGICTAVDEWFQAIQSQTEQLGDAAADLEGDLDAGKESIEGYIDEVIVATDDLLEQVDEAGVPDVDDGEAVAAALEEGFENVKDEFEQAKDEIGAVSTDDPEEFKAEFERIGGRLQDGSAMEEAFAGLEEFSDNEELDAAFNEEESCQALSGS